MKIKYIPYLFLALKAHICVSDNQKLHLRGVTEGRHLQDFGACTSPLAKYEDCVNNESIQVGATCTSCVDSQLPTKPSFDFCQNFECQETFIQCGCNECAIEATNFLMCIFGCADDLCQDTADDTLTTSPPTSPETSPTTSPAFLPDQVASTVPRNSCGIQECVLELQACVTPCEVDEQECSIETCVDTFNTCVAPCLL